MVDACLVVVGWLGLVWLGFGRFLVSFVWWLLIDYGCLRGDFGSFWFDEFGIGSGRFGDFFWWGLAVVG